MITQLDHVLIGTADLDSAMAWWESLAGVRPVLGGAHVGLGTRNALVAAGPYAYLELLAPDPEQSVDSPLVDGLRRLVEPRPVGWCYGCDSADATQAQLASRSVAARSMPLSREKDGRSVHWTLLHPVHDLGRAIPFLIDWGDAERPIDAVPKGCELVEATPIHPDPQAARAFLGAMGIDQPVESGIASGLRLRFETPRGELRVGP